MSEKDKDESRLQPPTDKTLEEDGKIKGKPSKDYLWQYEYHRDTGRPYFQTKGIPYVHPDIGSKTEKMKKVLLSQKRVRIFVPRKEGESDKVLQSVNINGYRLDFPKQTYLDLPEQIADLLKDSLIQDEQALQSFRIDTSEKEQALL